MKVKEPENTVYRYIQSNVYVYIIDYELWL